MSRPQSPAPPPYLDSNFIVHDWTSFFQPQDFEAPKAEHGIDAFAHRLSQNFSGFFGNYVIVCGMCIVFACIAEPALIVGIGLVVLVMRYRDTELPLIASICLSLLLAGGTTFIWSIFVGVAVILVHSTLHLPVQPLHAPPPPPPSGFGAEVRSAWSSAASILVGQAAGLRQRIASTFNQTPVHETLVIDQARGTPRSLSPFHPPPRPPRPGMPSRVQTEPSRHMQQSQHTRTNSGGGGTEPHGSPHHPYDPELHSPSMDYTRRRKRDGMVLMQPLHEE